MSVCEALKDVGQIEGNPKMEGRIMGVIIAPSVKKKPTTSSAPKPAAPKPAPAKHAEAPKEGVASSESSS
jgi:hypothetical protein